MLLINSFVCAFAYIVNNISIFMVYLMPKQNLSKNSDSLIQPISGVDTFPKYIDPKGNVITWLEFELALCNVAVQLVSHNATETDKLRLTLTKTYRKLKAKFSSS